jgi:hypothetical protein
MNKIHKTFILTALLIIGLVFVFIFKGTIFAAVHTGGTILGGSSATSLTSSAVCSPNGGVCSATLASLVGMRMPYAATVNQLYGFQASAPASGSSCSFGLRVSPACTGAYSSTALSCTIAGNGSTKTCQNISSSVSVNAGDCVQILFTEVGTCNGYASWGFEAY